MGYFHTQTMVHSSFCLHSGSFFLMFSCLIQKKRTTSALNFSSRVHMICWSCSDSWKGLYLMDLVLSCSWRASCKCVYLQNKQTKQDLNANLWMLPLSSITLVQSMAAFVEWVQRTSTLRLLLSPPLLLCFRTKPMGCTLARGLLAFQSWTSPKILPHMGQKSSAASYSWAKAWRWSWWTRKPIWIPEIFHFTRSSRTRSRTSRGSRGAWRAFSEASASTNGPGPRCPNTSLRGNSGVTRCWCQPEIIWTGWVVGFLSTFPRSETKMRLKRQRLRRCTSIWNNWNPVCNADVVTAGK